MLEFHNLLRLVTRLRIWGRSSESFAREWDRGGRFDWLPELSIPGRGHADFSLEGFAKGYSRFIAEKRCDLFDLDIVLEQAGCSVHAPMSEIRDGGLTHQTGKASGEDWAGEGHRLCQFLDLPPTLGRVMNQSQIRADGLSAQRRYPPSRRCRLLLNPDPDPLTEAQFG